ncbi:MULTISPECIES: pentapeptide repeat-containing protein [unclassified Crossiella]|uniref:pentapeptide repeat-containing protein n=1 Tax=unclassified Crossiella TaxID=2620835 RepID=UPI0020002838|nr:MULTISPECIES: pentapeptide repeat-containing protein [unclassified Crossiella]MCK2237847.1 pentapeptide repeat-containing protein [Crossiella sp. S99.2]MCK2255133.1 pentapeptide repeat-containing protein [Crossiella sp. S99.1]
MEPWLWIGGGAAGLVTAVVLLIVRARRADKDKQSVMLGATIAGAIGVLGLAVGWLLGSDPGAGRAEALKTGGVASGALIALYALWLNDRRRRTEEERREIERDRQTVEVARQELEGVRATHDRERVADERFARSVELLGHEADQVRVGALHALVGLARAHPQRTQTVVDVLCSYLRRPFQHKRYAALRDQLAGDDIQPLKEPKKLPGAEDEQTRADDRERQVRLAAQRLIAEILRNAPEEVVCSLDLTGAVLENFALTKCRVETFSATDAEMYAGFTLDAVTFTGTVELTGSLFYGKASFSTSEFHGEVQAAETEFHDDAIFSFIKAFKYVNLESAVFKRAALFDESTIETLNLDLADIGEVLGMQNVELTNPEDRLRLPRGWRAVLDRKGKVLEVRGRTTAERLA